MGYFSFYHWCCDPCHQLVDLEKWPNSPVKYLHWPVFFSGTGYIPPATPYNYTPTVLWVCSLDGGLKRSGSTGGLNTTIPCLRAWILVWHGAR